MKKSIEQLINPKILWQKPVYSYQKAGNILILAGSRDKSHVPVQIAESAIKAGSAHLIIGYPEGLKYLYKDLMPIEYSRPLPETASGSLSYKALNQISELVRQSTVIVVGPSLGNNAETLHLAWDIIVGSSIPCIIGGSGIASLIAGIAAIKKKEMEIESYFSNTTSKKIVLLEGSEAANLVEIIFGKEIKKEYLNRPDKIAVDLASKIKCTLIIFEKSEINIADSDFISIDKCPSDLYKNIIYGVIASFVDKNPQNLAEALKTALYISEKAVSISLSENSSTSSATVIKNIKKAIILAEEEAFPKD